MRRLQRLHGIAAGDGAPAPICRQERRSEALLAPPPDHLGDGPLPLILGRARVEIRGRSGLGLSGCPGMARIGFIGAGARLALTGKPLQKKYPSFHSVTIASPRTSYVAPGVALVWIRTPTGTLAAPAA